MPRDLLICLAQTLPSFSPVAVNTLRDANGWAALGHRVTVAAPMARDEAEVRAFHGLRDDVALVGAGAPDEHNATRVAHLREARARRHDTLLTRITSLAATAPRGLTVAYERHGLQHGWHARGERVAVARRRRLLVVANSETTLADLRGRGLGHGEHGVAALISGPEPVPAPRPLAGAPSIAVVAPAGRQLAIVHELVHRVELEWHLYGPMWGGRDLTEDGRHDDVGPDEAERLARELSAHPRVVEHGLTPPAQLAGRLADHALAFVWYPRTSLPWLTPSKLREVQAAACATVAADLPGARAMAGDSAVLVAPDDTEGLAAALLELAADEDHREAMRASALENARRATPIHRVGRIDAALAAIE